MFFLFKIKPKTPIKNKNNDKFIDINIFFSNPLGTGNMIRYKLNKLLKYILIAYLIFIVSLLFLSHIINVSGVWVWYVWCISYMDVREWNILDASHSLRHELNIHDASYIYDNARVAHFFPRYLVQRENVCRLVSTPVIYCDK